MSYSKQEFLGRISASCDPGALLGLNSMALESDLEPSDRMEIQSAIMSRLAELTDSAKKAARRAVEAVYRALAAAPNRSGGLYISGPLSMNCSSATSALRMLSDTQPIIDCIMRYASAERREITVKKQGKDTAVLQGGGFENPKAGQERKDGTIEPAELWLTLAVGPGAIAGFDALLGQFAEETSDK